MEASSHESMKATFKDMELLLEWAEQHSDRIGDMAEVSCHMNNGTVNVEDIYIT